MERLGRWRDGVEAVQRALKSREAKSGDPDGTPALRAWAWSTLDRLAYVTYDVRKPTHDVVRGVDRTSGLVIFTVGGFRADESRVERTAAATVTTTPKHVDVRLWRVLT